MSKKNSEFGEMLRTLGQVALYGDEFTEQRVDAAPKGPDIYREVLRGMIQDNDSNATGLFAKAQALKQSLEGRFIEREPEILGVLAGLFSNEPVLLIGPPGTGKTKLVEKLGEAINGKYFYYLLHQFMEADELLGPPNVKKYIEEGKYERSETGGLQQADIAFFDEPFKASSPVRNMLLDIMLYKRYKSGDKEIKLPLLGLFMAANEMPEDSEDDAFKDRLVIKVFVQKLSREGRVKMLSTQGEKDADRATTLAQTGIMKVDEVKAIQDEVDKRMVAAKSNKALMDSFDNTMADVQAGGLEISDRTFKKVWKVAASCSVVFNEPAVTSEDLAAALYLCAPKSEEDYGIIEDAISKNKLSPTYEATKIVMSVATEVYNKFEEAQKAGARKDRLAQYVRALDDLDATSKQAKVVAKTYNGNPKVTGLVTQLDQLIVKVDQYVDKERDTAKKELARQEAEREKLRRQQEAERDRLRRQREEQNSDNAPMAMLPAPSSAEPDGGDQQQKLPMQS
jgi:MoxR-like ATPase